MRRADRLFQIVQHLRLRKTRTTARELARRQNVSERTIYRDVQDLVRSGVPIEGEAGVGYVLRGFDVPPLMFTREEIEALVVGARMVETWTTEPLAVAARQALARARGTLEFIDPRQLIDQLPELLEMLEATCFRITDAVTDRYFRHEDAVAWNIEEGL